MKKLDEIVNEFMDNIPKIEMNNKIMEKEIRMKRYDEIAKAKETLMNYGYYVGNLYQVEDVQTYFDCTDDEALDVLDGAMDNEGTAEQVWTAIREVGDMMGLKEKEDDGTY